MKKIVLNVLTFEKKLPSDFHFAKNRKLTINLENEWKPTIAVYGNISVRLSKEIQNLMM